jgi:hypothetical protein
VVVAEEASVVGDVEAEQAEEASVVGDVEAEQAEEQKHTEAVEGQTPTEEEQAGGVCEECFEPVINHAAWCSSKGTAEQQHPENQVRLTMLHYSLTRTAPPCTIANDSR